MRPVDLPAAEAHDGERACYSFGQLAGPSNPFAGESGTALLWLINRVVFHPRGYALALNYREDPEAGTTVPEPVGWSIIDAGDGTPYLYGEEIEEDTAFSLVEALLGYAREHGRAPAPKDDRPE